MAPSVCRWGRPPRAEIEKVGRSRAARRSGTVVAAHVAIREAASQQPNVTLCRCREEWQFLRALGTWLATLPDQKRGGRYGGQLHGLS